MIRTLPTAPKVVLLVLAKLTTPLLVKPVSVPRLVMFGCAAVVTVPAVVALVAELAVP